MKQHCNMWTIWGTWIGLPAFALVLGFAVGWMGGVFVLGVGIIAQIVYLRVFPRFSRVLGYGSVADISAGPIAPSSAPIDVTFYTAGVCPFCPIVRERLEALSDELNLTINEIDVTFRLDTIREKGIRSVPVVEVNDRLLHGNATSSQLALFLQEAT